MRTSPATPRRFVEIADRTERSLFFATTELIHAIEVLSWTSGSLASPWNEGALPTLAVRQPPATQRLESLGHHALPVEDHCGHLCLPYSCMDDWTYVCP